MLYPKALFLLASVGSAAVAQSTNNTAIRQTCDAIQAQFSDASKVMTFRGIGYFEAIEHWIKSSEQEPTCVVQPASAQDLSVAVSLSLPLSIFQISTHAHVSCPDSLDRTKPRPICSTKWRTYIQSGVLQHQRGAHFAVQVERSDTVFRWNDCAGRSWKPMVRCVHEAGRQRKECCRRTSKLAMHSRGFSPPH